MRSLMWCGVFLLSVLVSACAQEKSRRFQIARLVPVGDVGFDVALYQTTGVRLVPGNTVDLVHDGDVFRAMAEDIRRAKHSVNLVSFIWRPGSASDQLLEAFTERGKAGVTCRVLVDPYGSQGFEEHVKPVLIRAGCKAHVFRSIPTDELLARNHRKMLIVDGRIGITGGFGIQDQWLGKGDSPTEWRDVNVRVEGPVVLQMQQAFSENWQETTGQLLPKEDFPQLHRLDAPATRESPGALAAFVSSTAHPEVSTAERITQLMVQSARRRLWIGQSYFTPNDALEDLLTGRAHNGVDVRVVAPGDKNDHPEITLLQRATYDELLPAGVRIWEYEPSMMHAKTMLVDDDLVLIGSINYDVLSFRLMEEGSLLVRDAKTAKALEQSFHRDFARSREQRPESK